MLVPPAQPFVVVVLALLLAAGAPTRASIEAGSTADEVARYVHLVSVRADSLRRVRELPAALTVLDSAIASLDRSDHPEAARTLRLRRPRLLLLGGEARDALAAADALIARAHAEGDSGMWAGALYHRGCSLDALGDGNEAKASYVELVALSSSLRDTALMARGETRLSRRLRHEGDLDAAALHLARSDSLFLAIRDSNMAMGNLVLAGMIDVSRGRREEGLAAWRRCAEASRGWKVKSIYVNSLNNIAVQEALNGDPSVAMECWRSARDVSLQAGGRWRDSLRPSMNLALLLAEFGRYEEAESSLKSSLSLAREKGYADIQAEIVLMLAEISEMRGNWDRSLEMNRQAVELFRVRGDDQDRFWALKGVAVGLAAKDSLEAALAILDRLRPTLDDLPVDNHLEFAELEMGVLTDSGRPRDALSVLPDALALARGGNSVRKELDLLLRAVDAHRALDDADSMIARLEEARAVYETLREIPRDARWRENRSSLAYRIYPELARLRRARDGLSAAALHTMLQPYKARTLLERITRPGEVAPQDLAAPVALDRLQSEFLHDDELLLDFFSGPECSFLFVIDAHRCEVVELAQSDSLRARAQSLSELLSTRPADPTDRKFVDRACAALREEILPRWVRRTAGVRRVLFVPDGLLIGLPLSVLLGPDEPLAAAAVQRVPSTQILARLRSGPEVDPDGSVLAMVAAGDALPGARQEVEDLARRFKNVNVRELGGVPDPVDEDGWNGCAVLHIASHARLVDQDPWRSAILFRAASRSDGEGAVARSTGARTPQLTAAQIAELRLDASLVVLSGCQTMGGERFRGAGALGLSTAFLSAGAHEVLATLWRVDDDATRMFMDSFYQELGRGLPAVDALHAAQSELRSRPGTAHPFYWAGFVLLGDNPGNLHLLVRPASTPWWALAAALGAAALFAAFIRARQRSRDL